jgi:hypothetical protein
MGRNFTNQIQSRRFYAKEDRNSIHNDKQPVNSETNPKVLPNDIKLFTGLLLLEAIPLVGHSWTHLQRVRLDDMLSNGGYGIGLG